MPLHCMPVQGLVLRSVHDDATADGFHRLPCRHRVQLALRFRCRRHRFCTGSPDPRRHPFRSRQPPVSGQLLRDGRRRADHPVPVSCCLSATGIRFSGHPIPAEGFRLPRGRPTGPTIRRTPSGLPRSTRSRCDRGGCPLYPGDGGALPVKRPPSPAPAASQRPVPTLRWNIPSGGAHDNEASIRGSCPSPVRSSPRL